MLMNSFFGSVFIQQLRFASRRAFKGENSLSLLPKNNSNEFNRNTQKVNKNPNRLNVKSEKDFIFGGKSQYLANDWQNNDPEKLLEVDKDLELYSRSKKLFREKVIEEDERKRKSIKLAIIKKKMDKLNGTREANFNLLTWDAKEQIKYLHLNEPETWTVEKISEMFPITESSCKKLLRSSWSPKTIDQLIEHDRRVIENWKLLAEMNDEKEPIGPAINIYEEYKNLNRLNILKYANGLPDVEFERKADIYNDSYSIHQTLLCKPGQFSKLIGKPDEKIKAIFIRNESVKLSKGQTQKEEKLNLIEEHLKQTKLELTNSISKIFSNIENNRVAEESKKKKLHLNKNSPNK